MAGPGGAIDAGAGLMNLVEGPSTLSDDRWIAGLDRPDAGVLSLVARPGGRSFWLPASLILEKLGKLRPEPGSRLDDAALLSIWLGAYAVEDIVLHHAEVLDADVLLALDASLRAADVRLWAVVDPVFADVARDALAPAVAQQVPWDAFHLHWSAYRFAPLAAPQPAVTLRAATAWTTEYERLATLARTSAMDGPYLVGFCAAAGWERERRPARDTLASRLRGLLSTFRDRACFASGARGAGVALRDAGWDLRIDLRRMAGDPVGERPARHLPPIHLAHLRWFRDPLVVAACVLANLELSRMEALSVRLVDVERDGGAIHQRRGSVSVPAVARPIVRAQRIARERDGASEVDYYLADRDGPLSLRSFSSMVLATLEEIGARLPRSAIGELPTEDERWLAERGVSFEWITRGDRPRRDVNGWHPDELARQVLLRLKDETMAPSAHRCDCEEGHVPPVPEAAPAWPRLRNHAAPAATHPWKRGPLGSGRTAAREDRQRSA